MDLEIINTGIPAIGVIKDVKFRVLLRENTLDEDENAADFDDEDNDENEEIKDEETNTEDTNKDQSVVTPPANGTIGNSSTNTEQYKKLTYKVNNEILTSSQIGYQAARGAVNETSFYEIENGKKYITLAFNQTDILNNIRLSNNGKEITYSVVSEDKSKNTMSIRFEIPSLSNEITVKTNVTAMGRDISFGIKFLETTLELISTEEFENLSNNIQGSESTSSSGVLSGVSSTISNLFSGASNTSSENVEVSEEAVENLSSLAKEYFKKYTITNEIISDSAIGRSMARKYLNQTSIIEDIDGQLYATITFSSSDSMRDFRIEVNGETTTHTVPLHDRSNNLISLRFPINSINDDIRAYMYINPMRMTINFGIKFLEDSMILIEEGTIGEEGADDSSSLADTLSNVNETSNRSKEQVSAVKIAASTSVMMIVLNQILAGLGVVFKRVKVKSLLKKITQIK